jgi:hypothetical protein
MLPEMSITLDEIFRGNVLSGTTYLFDWNQVLTSTTKANTSLDRFLTIRLGSYIQIKKYKVPILLLFAPANDSFKIIVCSKSDIDFTPCLHRSAGMPGYIDYGDEPIEKNARSFMYYSGQQIYRTYHFIERPESAELLCSDFGNQFGLTVSECDKSFYDDLIINPSEKPEYSFVPLLESEEIVTPQNSLILSHMIIQLKKRTNV